MPVPCNGGTPQTMEVGMPTRSLIVIILAVAFSALAGACEGESSVCVPGGDCEDMALRQCSCCATVAEQNTCQDGVIDACDSGNLTVGASPASCADFNAAWDQHIDAGSEPCEAVEMTDEELEEFCKGPQPAGGASGDPSAEGS